MNSELRFTSWLVAIGFLIAAGANGDAGNIGMTLACSIGCMAHAFLAVLGSELP